MLSNLPLLCERVDNASVKIQRRQSAFQTACLWFEPVTTVVKIHEAEFTIPLSHSNIPRMRAVHKII